MMSVQIVVFGWRDYRTRVCIRYVWDRLRGNWYFTFTRVVVIQGIGA